MVAAGVQTYGHITVTVYDRHGRVLRRDEQRNTTCDGLHEWIVDALDETQSAPPTPDALALGRSNTTPTSADTGLNDEVDRVTPTVVENEGTQLRLTFNVGTGEANVDTDAGETLSECGVYAGSYFLNHALFDNEYEKNDQKAMNIEVLLGFETKSGDA